MARGSKPTKPCGEPVNDGGLVLACAYPRRRTKTKCTWHWLLTQPIEMQVAEAGKRLRLSPHFGQERKRVPESEWPAGERWCAGCQNFVPLFYSSGSRCRACASQAAHASHVKRTYDLDPDEYQRLLEWQGGRCFVCGQIPRVRRLAVDHDHRTGEVRGLLCANDEWGCNVLLARVLNDPQAARRLVEYVEHYPLRRMRDGEPARTPPRKPSIADSLREQIARQGQPIGLSELIGTPSSPTEQGEWRPFG